MMASIFEDATRMMCKVQLEPGVRCTAFAVERGMCHEHAEEEVEALRDEQVDAKIDLAKEEG